jgi:predicted Zn-dependent protease with MMP-like domain
MPLRRRGRQARRHPRRRQATPASLAHLPFEELVAEALDRLPADIRRLLDNVAVVIEDEPSAEQLSASDMAPAETLYGLYEGTPAVVYGADWVQLPNKISLFRLPLEADFPDPLDLADEVRRTVVHELAHHAGFDDRRLRRLGFD